MDIVEELRNDRENDILVCLVAKSGARAPTAEAVFRSWGGCPASPPGAAKPKPTLPSTHSWRTPTLVEHVNVGEKDHEEDDRDAHAQEQEPYRYSAQVVYNNFPWPEADVRHPMTDVRAVGSRPSNVERIERTAQAILDARAAHPGSSLADLYDDSFMPPDLREAHCANDRAVMAAYGFPAGMAHLLSLI